MTRTNSHTKYNRIDSFSAVTCRSPFFMTARNTRLWKMGRSRRIKILDIFSAYQFFRTHAGGIIGNNAATALALAKAERYANMHDLKFEWSDDWSVGSHREFYGKGSCYEDHEPSTCESCVLWNAAHTKVLASLSCIDDASAEYRRVIEAELALEAMPTVTPKGHKLHRV